MSEQFTLAFCMFIAGIALGAGVALLWRPERGPKVLCVKCGRGPLTLWSIGKHGPLCAKCATAIRQKNDSD